MIFPRRYKLYSFPDNILKGEHDMITALMQQTYKSGRSLSEREIAHIMIALLMAGQHTSSTSGTWTLLHVAHNPEVA